MKEGFKNPSEEKGCFKHPLTGNSMKCLVAGLSIIFLEKLNMGGTKSPIGQQENLYQIDRITLVTIPEVDLHLRSCIFGFEQLVALFQCLNSNLSLWSDDSDEKEYLTL